LSELLLFLSRYRFPLRLKPKVSPAAWSGVHETVKGRRVLSVQSLVAWSAASLAVSRASSGLMSGLAFVPMSSNKDVRHISIAKI
jgi:hypothetical protein